MYTKRTFPRPVHKPGVMNKTEALYANELKILQSAGEIISWHFEAVTFKLAYRTTYTPDFLVVYPDHFEVVEIKGFLRDDAAVKFKTAADKFPHLKWKMIRWKRKQWETLYEY